MSTVSIREPKFSDEEAFTNASLKSGSLHNLWTSAPKTHEEFCEYINRYKQSNNKSFLVINAEDELCGVFNLSEIVRGCFQNAYLGYYAFLGQERKGQMSQGLKLVLEKAFNELNLHRLEANIQPDNISSIHLVKNNGFRKEGFSPRYLKINGVWRDHERWAITVEDWNSR